MLAKLKERVKNFWEKTKAYFDVETDDIPDYYDFEPEPEVVKVNSAAYKTQTVKVKSENKIKEFFECLAIKADDVDLPEEDKYCYNNNLHSINNYNIDMINDPCYCWSEINIYHDVYKS